jgi:DNA (cytosine-5)-methyltransferase 1
VDPPPPVDAHVNSEPPHNCTTCALREEEEMQARGRIIRKAGKTIGVAVHGASFHVGDFALLRAEKGPARIVQLVGFYSGDPIWIKVQLLGRVSDLVDLLPADEPKDEVSLFTLSAARPTSFFASATCSLQTRWRMCRSRIC